MKWLLIAMIPVLMSCTDPRDTILPKDVSKPDTLKPVLDKLSPEERELLAGYVARHTMGGARLGIRRTHGASTRGNDGPQGNR